MALMDQSEVANLPADDWRNVALGDLADRLKPPSDFPCTFSQNAFRRSLIQFSFVETVGQDGFSAAADDLCAYLADCADWDGRVDSAKPLLVIFSEAAASFDTLAGYQSRGWAFMQYLHDHDPSQWPRDVSQDPETPFWSFCYGGVQLFVNMSAPLHKTRKSRNLGRYLTLVINPRERFDIVAGDTPEGARIRSKIRARAESYDGVPHSDLLGSFQKGELEWVQYALPDRNEGQANGCPFRFRGESR